MNSRTLARNLSLLAVATLAPAAMEANTRHAQLAMEKEGVQLTRQLEDVARDVRYHAGRLNAVANDMNVTRSLHMHHLIRIRELINEGLQPALVRLSEIQGRLPKWKQDSVDKMVDAARSLSGNANEAILSKNEVRTMPPAMNMEYKQLIARVYDDADILVKTSDAAANYAAARWKATSAGLNVPKQ